MPRLTEAEADDLAVKALMAMAVDEYKYDLRAQVKALEDTGCQRVEGGCQCRRSTALREVLALLDRRDA